MIKKIVLGIIFSLLMAASLVFASEVGVLDFNFIAPTVPSTGDAPNQVGLIVYDSTNKVFWGRSTDSAPNEWLPLSPLAGTSIPSGTILPYGGTSAPAGYLVANGAAVSRTTYAALFAAIGTAYGAGDGTTTFNLPDLRGRFLRGVDSGTGRDPDAGTRTAMNSGGATGDNVGSVQTGGFTSHGHRVYSNSSAGANTNLGGASATVFGGITSGTGNGYITSAAASGGVALVESTGGNETRPLNAYVNFIIKY